MGRRALAFAAWIAIDGLATALIATESPVPRHGGVLDWYDIADPGRLDIHTESAAAVLQATAGVFSGLLQMDPADPTRIAPDLAERWEVSRDGLLHTFHLRSGVRWHDGQPFTAADVKATFDRLLDPAFRSPRCGTMLRPLVAGFQVVDPNTVTVRLRFATPVFLQSLASAWCRIVAQHVLARHGDLNRPEALIGTGPFRFKRYEPGTLIEWERNPDYYRHGLPYLDGVRQFILVGTARQLAAAKAGQVMLSGGTLPMSRVQAEELKRARPEVALYLWPLNTLSLVHLNAARPPFSERDLRRAAFLALDRQEFFRKGLDGVGVPCAILDPRLHGPYALPLAGVERLPGCRRPKDHDRMEAARLVAKHYPNGVDVEIVTRALGNYVDRMQLVVGDLGRVGIRGRSRVYESTAGFLAFARGDFDVIGTQDTGMVLTDPSSVFSVLFTTDAGRNWERWSDPRVDRLAEQALEASDMQRRIELYHRLQRHLLAEDTGAVPMGWVEGWYFVDPRVRDYRPALTVYDANTFVNVWLSR
jgi:peptide/nickel transport system substrate-binding protein